MRITAQLLDSIDGGHVWGEKYDSDAEDVFDLQDEITRNVVGSIAPQIELAELERSRRLSDSGLTVLLHQLLVSLSVNLVGTQFVSGQGQNAGLRTFIALSNGNMVRLSASGTISLIPADGDCLDTSPGGENSLFSAQADILHLESQDDEGTIPTKSLNALVGPGGAKGPGTYQVCFKAKSTGESAFKATGLSVTLQDQLISLAVNEASPNEGLRVAAPKAAGNRFRYSSARKGAVGHKDDTVSLIHIAGECNDPLDNPRHGSPDASGHILSHAEDLTFRHLDQIALMNPGHYCVCFRQGNQLSFIATGIIITVQTDITTLIVNSIRSRMATVPKTTGNHIAYCLDTDCLNDGLATDRLAFISGDRSCQDLNHNPTSANLDRSGHLAPVGQSRVLRTSDVDVLLHSVTGVLSTTRGLGRNFQLCFRRNEGPFVTTGLTLRVQEDILGLITNGVMPVNGLQTALPRAIGAVVGYYRAFPGVPGDAISLIRAEAKIPTCDMHGIDQNPPQPTSNASGYWIAGGTDRIVAGSGSVADMNTGLYAVCFRPNDGFWSAAGLSVKIQSALIAIDVNMGGKAQTASLVKKIKNSLALTGDAQLDGALGASLIMSRGQLPGPRCSRILCLSTCAAIHFVIAPNNVLQGTVMMKIGTRELRRERLQGLRQGYSS